jgi:molybdopterin synthase sulfur carrier subunit
VEIRFFAYIRDYTGTKKVAWPEPAADLAELLHQLSRKYGTKFRDAVFDQSLTELNAEIIILINGRHVQHLDGIRTKLTATDLISIFPMVAGG